MMDANLRNTSPCTLSSPSWTSRIRGRRRSRTMAAPRTTWTPPERTCPRRRGTALSPCSVVLEELSICEAAVHECAPAIRWACLDHLDHVSLTQHADDLSAATRHVVDIDVTGHGGSWGTGWLRSTLACRATGGPEKAAGWAVHWPALAG